MATQRPGGGPGGGAAAAPTAAPGGQYAAPPPAPAPVDEAAVAEFLLRKKYFLSALELHQELQEGNNGMHSVSALNKFFNDGNTYASLVKRMAEEEAKNKTQSYGGKTASIQSPFVADGLQSAMAARDQKIALLEYRLRCTEEEATAAKRQLQDALLALPASGGQGSATPKELLSAAASAAGSSTASTSAPGTDEEGGRITDGERRTLNALVRRYLLARGYKATAVALAEEVADQDLSGRTDDSSLLALPGMHRRGGTGAGVPVLSLLAMHRQRIAPIQALAEENERRTDSEMAALRAELRAVHEQLESAVGEVSASKARVAELEAELMHAKTVRGSGGSSGAGQQQGSGQQGQGQQGPNAPSAPAPSAPAQAVPNPASLAGKITLSHAPALLKTVVEGLPTLARITVTKQRAALAPLLSHAAAAEPSVEGRRTLILSFLGLLRRPTYAERQLLKVQFSVLAGKLGASGTEQELLPEVLLLAKTGKVKEKRALAAALAGVLASHVSDKRVDTLLACLADLADSKHAVVRVGVVEGLAAIAATLAERWQKALASGVVPGQGSAVEAFATRQYAAVEETMWRVLMGGEKRGAQDAFAMGLSVGGGDASWAGSGGSGSSLSAEAEELAVANEAEHPLTVPAVLALAGTPAGEAAEKAAAAAAAAAAKTGKGPLAERAAAQAIAVGGGALPAAWFAPPATVLAAACGQLVPVLVPWAYRLGGLWSRVLPGWLGLLEETLYTPGPGAPVITPAPGTPAPSVRATAWHARRIQAVLQVLGASSVRLRQAMLDAGYAIQYTGPADPAPAAPAPSTDGSTAPPTTSTTGAGSGSGSEYIYELFDNASGAAVTAFPPEIPLAAAMRGGVVTYPAGTTPAQHAAGQLPAQQRQALVLAALLRGTASVRRRKNGHINPATLPPGTPVWQILPDNQATVSWPALQWAVRTLVPTLLRQAAQVNRSSASGREILDSYSDALSSVGTALGPAFTSFVIRPVFLRAFGIPADLPPPMPAPGAAPLPPPVPGLPQPLVLSLQPGSGGRTLSLLPLAQVLLGVPSNSGEARKAAMAAAVGNFSPSTLNYASAGPKGGDWPYVLPELAWLARDSPENPSHYGKTASALQAMVAARQAEIASAPPPTAPGVPLSIVTEKLGGAYNADGLLPLFGSGVLACPALATRDHLDHAIRALVGLVATNKGGWGGLQSSLEDLILRAGGGNSSTGMGGAGQQGKGKEAGKDGHEGGSGSTKPASAASTAADPVAAAAAERAAAAAANLSHILHEVLPRMAGASDPAVRACAAGFLRSTIPLLHAGQIADPWLPTVKKLTEDASNPSVVKAGVRALATIYSTPAANDAEVRGLVNGEVTSLLANGPKDVVLEVLRSLMRAVPVAPAPTRDGFILDRLLEMTERIAGAAEAGSAAMRELVAQIGDVDPGDVHNAAAAAVRATRNAAIEGAAPWPGAKADDLEETAMALCECIRSYGSVIVGPETKGMLREASARLLKADLLEPSYRDMMRATLMALFPSQQQQQQQGGLTSPHGHGMGHVASMGGSDAFTGLAGGAEYEHGQGHEEYGGSGGHEGHGGVDLTDFAGMREAGIAPLSFDHAGAGGGGGGVDDSFDSVKALSSSLTSAMKALPGMGMGGMGGGLSMSMGSGLGMSSGLGMGSLGSGLKGMGGMSMSMGMGLKGFGMGGGGGAPAAAEGGATGAGAAGGPKARRPSGAGGGEAGPATFSLDSFAGPSSGAAAQPSGPGSRRPSGANLSAAAAAEQPSVSLSSFMGGGGLGGSSSAAAPAAGGHPPAHPPSDAGHGASSSKGGGLLKGIGMPGVHMGKSSASSSAAAPAAPAAGTSSGGGTSSGMSMGMGRFGERLKKMGEAMDKAAEKILD